MENRLLLYAVTGREWGDTNVSASLYPDGSSTEGYPSSLFSQLNSVAPAEVWQKEFARALQTWASVSPLNFHFVDDDGSASGTAGSVQGDDRFGDIRLGSHSRADGYVAYAYYPSNWSTRGGDIFLNSATTFRIGSSLDLYSTLLHESGHSLGLGHAGSDSVMYPYIGLYSGLKADDVAGIQAVYGERQHDAYDQAATNDNAASATTLSIGKSDILTTDADLTSLNDVDYYQVTVPDGTDGGLAVSIDTRDISFLAPKVEIYDAAGNLLGAADSAADYESLITITVGGLAAGDVITVVVDGSTGDVFGMGAYQLELDFTATPPQPPDNEAPVAAADSFSVAEDSTLAVAASGLLINDTDADGDSLTAALVAGPSNGTLAMNSDGSFDYTPDANFNGSDSFTYRANDGVTNSNVATVTITVSAAPDAPVAAADSYGVNENTVLAVAATGVLVNDSDADGDSLTATLVSGPSHGTVALAADGSFDYTPDDNFNGSDSFTYKANDGVTDSKVATVTITVAAVNDGPVASGDSYGVNEDGVLAVAATGVLGNDSDADGDSLTAVLASGPGHGTLTLNSDGSFEYTPEADFNGSDSFTYKAADGQTDSNVATVSVTVDPVDDTPVTDLGVVDFLEIGGIDLTGGDRLFAARTSHGCYFTIETLFSGTPAEIEVKLLDANLNELAASNLSADGGRIDWDVVANEQYFVRLSGNASGVDLRLTNLIHDGGDSIIVYGTAGDDRFEFTAGSMYQVVINGVEYEFDPAVVDSVSFDGGEGNDVVVLTGSAGNDTAVVYDHSAVMKGPGYKVSVTGTTTIEVNGGGDSGDVVHMYDSPGNDLFRGSPNQGVMTGAGFSNSASGFAYVHGYAKKGGHDVVQFTDSAGNDVFVARPKYAKISGDGFFLRAKFFDEVYATSSGGMDEASLYGSRQSEVFTASTTTINLALSGEHDGNAAASRTITSGEMRGSSFYYKAEGFRYLHGYARQGGTDVAHMYDSAGDDTFIAKPTFGKIFDSGRTFQIRAKRFDYVHAYATGGGRDTAILYDSAGDDIFVSKSTFSRMSGDGFNNRAKLFEVVFGKAVSGGNDRAFFHDSKGSDVLEAVDQKARLNYGDAVVEAWRFGWTQAISRAGGTDTVSVESHDFVMEALGNWLDV